MIDVAFVAFPLALLLALARGRDERALAVLVVAGARAALAAGLFHFTPPSQVIELVDFAGGDPLRLTQHEWFGVWWPRYLFTWPAILAAGATGRPLESTFPLWCVSVLPVEAFLAYRATTCAAERVRGRLVLGSLVSAAVMAVATFMNGRLIVAHAGLALTLAVQATAIRAGAFQWWAWPALVLGALMGNMTTGAGVVAYAQAIVGTIGAARVGAGRARATTVFVVLATLLLGPLVVADAWKNVTFFDADALALLRHGLGSLLLVSPVLMLVAAAVVAAAVWGFVRAWRHVSVLSRRERRTVPAAIAVALASVGGLFGYSTLSMAVPAGLVLLAQGAVSGAAWAKRIFDVAVAATALAVLAPIVVILALAVRLTSPGPAFYGAVRIGREGRPFRQWKLRTMVVGADSAGFRTADRDVRVTPLGRWLRMLSLDELPQLWNVVRGDMSLVGPRPAAPAQLDDYTPSQRTERVRVRPGITGLAQVSGRSRLTVDESIAFDLAYARDASVWHDLLILWRTVPAVMSRRGTN